MDKESNPLERSLLILGLAGSHWRYMKLFSKVESGRRWPFLMMELITFII